MAYDLQLADRVREALVNQKKVEEKKMFSGLCFMVNGKMCVCVSHDDLLCRIGPEKFATVSDQHGVRTMMNGGRQMTGYVYVEGATIASKKTFMEWINMCLDYNQFAKAAKKKTRKKG